MSYKYSINKYLFLIFCYSTAAVELPAVAAPRLGVALSPEAERQADTLIFPDGRGLPLGSGTVAQGRDLYARSCVSCHGSEGRGGIGGELAGGERDLTRPHPDQNLGTYWPYATTLFDFIRRSMPMLAPWSLSDAEVYALCAYLLYLNGLLPEDARVDGENLGSIDMPNRHGFEWIEAVPP